MSKSSEYQIIGLLWIIISLVIDVKPLIIIAAVIAILFFVISGMYTIKESYDHR